MQNERIKRTILFDCSGEDESHHGILYAKIAVIDWYKFFCNESEKLRKALNREHISTVKLKINDLDMDLVNETLRMYVYRSKWCHLDQVNLKQVTHAIQISVKDNTTITECVNGDDNFSAKVYISEEEIIKIVEDILMDIQMFYTESYDIEFISIADRRNFSKYKAEFVKEKNLKGYWNNAGNTEYVSLASFCRNTNGIEYEYYVSLWREYGKWLDDHNIIKGRLIIKETDISEIIKRHPNGDQISAKRIEKLLFCIPAGYYCLIRSEKKPKNKKAYKEITTRFGMKKWKTGRIKIVPIEERYSWTRLQPYISIFEFQWRGNSE